MVPRLRLMSSAYNIRLTQLSPEDGGVYLAWVPDLPGCMSDGNTPEEAYANAMDAIDDWISEAIRLGRVVPMPGRGWRRPETA